MFRVLYYIPDSYRQWVKIFSFGILCLLGCTLESCVKNEFKLTFKLPEAVNSTYRLSYYASDPKGGIQVETAVAVSAGKAELTGFTRYPTLGIIYTGFSDIPSVILYAERGDEITLSGTDSDPIGWIVDGNKINKELTDWRIQNEKTIRSAHDVARDSKDKGPRRTLNKAVALFVEENKNSKAAPLILSTYFDASLEPAEFHRLNRLLDQSGVQADMLQLLSRQDINTATAPIFKPADLKLSDLILQTEKGYADTLCLATSSAPTLIYYWRKNDQRHSEIIDTLKTLVKWRTDSAGMPIVDIGLCADSLQWNGRIHRDSLRHTIRAFMPRGFADTTAMAHGVRSTPWFVVTSGKGKTIYVGPDISEATRNFRKLRPKRKS